MLLQMHLFPHNLMASRSFADCKVIIASNGSRGCADMCIITVFIFIFDRFTAKAYSRVQVLIASFLNFKWEKGAD